MNASQVALSTAATSPLATSQTPAKMYNTESSSQLLQARVLLPCRRYCRASSSPETKCRQVASSPVCDRQQGCQCKTHTGQTAALHGQLSVYVHNDKTKGPQQRMVHSVQDTRSWQATMHGHAPVRYRWSRHGHTKQLTPRQLKSWNTPGRYREQSAAHR